MKRNKIKIPKSKCYVLPIDELSRCKMLLKSNPGKPARFTVNKKSPTVFNAFIDERHMVLLEKGWIQDVVILDENKIVSIGVNLYTAEELQNYLDRGLLSEKAKLKVTGLLNAIKEKNAKAGDQKADS